MQDNRNLSKIDTHLKQQYIMPKVLKVYENDDFATQQKARFIYYMLISILVGMVFIIATSAYLQIVRTEFNGIYLPVLLPIVTAMFFFIGCLILLIKGFYGLSAHLLMATAIITIWLVMWIDKGHYMTRLDTVVLIVALINLTPLFITKFKSTISIYVFANIFILIFFVWFWGKKMGLSSSVVIDYVIDTGIAILFTGVVGYNIFTIYKTTLDRALIEIKERKLSELELEKSRDQFQSLVSNIPGITYRCLNDNNWTMVYISSEIDRISGYPFTDFVNNKVRSYESIINRADNEIVVQMVGKAIIEGKPWELEYRINHSNGTIRWVYEKGRAVLNFENEIEFLDGFILDITDRKRAETDLKESEEKYRYLMENMNEVVMMVDNHDKVLFVNKKFTEKLGYKPDEIIGEIGYEKLLDPSDHERIIDENRKRFEKQINQYELSFRAKDGRKIDFLVSGSPMVDSEGNTIGSIGSMTDISERIIAENKLKDSEERYRMLINAFPDLIMVVNFTNEILYANPSMEIHEGVSLAKMQREGGVSVIHPEDIEYVNSEISNMITMEFDSTSIFENRVIKNDKISWRSSIVCKIQYSGEPALLFISKDITEKKILEAELEKYRNNLELLVKERTEELAASNEELNATNDELYDQREELQTSLTKLNETQKQLIQAEKMASLGVLSAGIAHEINNPLNFIQGGVLIIDNYFKDKLPEHFGEIEPFINAINVGVLRASKIVTSLSHYSRRDDLPKMDCDIHDIIDNCLVMLQNQLKNKVEIKKLFTDQPLIIFGNEGKLHQAILNIISNAEQSIDGTGTIEISTHKANSVMVLTITDSGCGISPENLQNIFDPFFTTKDPGKGTGLGLSISYNIVQEHNGTIEYESLLGKGTKAIMKLPINKFD